MKEEKKRRLPTRRDQHGTAEWTSAEKRTSTSTSTPLPTTDYFLHHIDIIFWLQRGVNDSLGFFASAIPVPFLFGGHVQERFCLGRISQCISCCAVR
jgi:hypothetical protein